MAGRARSIWDAFCEESGRIVNGDNGDVACDHYSLYEEDVKIMKVWHPWLPRRRGNKAGHQVLNSLAYGQLCFVFESLVFPEGQQSHVFWFPLV